jgi:hypothetical protein
MRKTTARRLQTRKEAEILLESLGSGSSDAYEAYRKLYRLWCGRNAHVLELRPLFSIPGVEPDGLLSVTAAFREEIRSIAVQILPSFADTKVCD